MVVEWAWCGLACGEELRLTGHHTFPTERFIIFAEGRYA